MVYTVHVKTNKAKECINQLSPSILEVHVHASPRDGAANDRLVELLTSHFSVGKSTIRILSGIKSKYKKIEIA